MSLADAINIALNTSPNVLRAKKSVEASQGIAMQTRAVAIPKLGITGNYTAVEPSDVDKPDKSNFPPGFEFDFGTDQNWRTQIRLVQSLYEGGRILSSLRAARLTREQSMLSYQVAVADTVLDVQIAYYAVLLAAQQISVQEASVELLTRELEDTRRRFEAGTVPKFNVLRAEVELAIAQPKLIRARNSYRISKNALANALGLNVPRDAREDIPLTLSGALEAEPWNIELPRALEKALQERKELAALEKGRQLRKQDLVSAKAGYKPALEAFGGYDAHNSMFSSDLTDELHGWMAGVQLRWDIFDGLRTRGRVEQAQAQYELSGIELDDTTRQIELQVRSAYSTFIEAGEVLQSTQKVLDQAEEALRLARARSEAGTSTQLDVLSAQTALTDARTIRVQALHDYCAARARLERAIGINVPVSTP
jgi:outer membrane protein TolC